MRTLILVAVLLAACGDERDVPPGDPGRDAAVPDSAPCCRFGVQAVLSCHPSSVPGCSCAFSCINDWPRITEEECRAACP